MAGTTIQHAVDSPQRGFDEGFRWNMSILSGASYLVSSLPPVFVDPLLEHHVRYGSRQYRHALWFIFPLCFLTLIATSTVMRLSRRILFATLPFGCAVVLSIPVFRPEVPHAYLFDESILWLLIAILALWFHNREIGINVTDCFVGPNKVDKTAMIEYLKEELLFWRTVLIGLAGGYIAIVISWVNLVFGTNRAIVGGNESEAFVLNTMSIIGIGFYSIVIAICPVAEAINKHSLAKSLFLEIKDTK